MSVKKNSGCATRQRGLEDPVDGGLRSPQFILPTFYLPIRGYMDKKHSRPSLFLIPDGNASEDPSYVQKIGLGGSSDWKEILPIQKRKWTKTSMSRRSPRNGGATTWMQRPNLVNGRGSFRRAGLIRMMTRKTHRP